MNKLVPIEFKNQRIMTTRVLSEQFGTEENNIIKNFNTNKERFIEGRHYYKLEGNELKDFKRLVNISNEPSIKFAPSLILWTDRGAARHAKILETDEAWEIYEQLEENYFNPKQRQLSPIDQLRLQYQAIEEHEEKINNLESKVEKIALTVNVNDGQAKTLRLLVEKRVKTLCFGNESSAYLNNTLRKKIYSYVWRSLKDYFNVTVYHNILRKDFEDAKVYISKLPLQGALLREVQEINNQITM